MTVYFALRIERHLPEIKIGFTTREPAVRVATFPGRHELLFTLPGGRAVEKAWHRRHDAARLRKGAYPGYPGALTEYFKPTPELVGDMAPMLAADRLRQLSAVQHRVLYRAHAVRSVGDGARA